MKTVLEELIEELRKSPLMNAAALVIIEQDKYLQKEKEAIVEAYETQKRGIFAMTPTGIQDTLKTRTGEQYYNEKYNKSN